MIATSVIVTQVSEHITIWCTHSHENEADKLMLGRVHQAYNTLEQDKRTLLSALERENVPCYG